MTKQHRTNDLVDDIHCVLVIENDDYRRYLQAVWNKQAVEGSLATDDIMAATMIRNKAKEMGSELANEELAAIVKALRVVLRRYGSSRKERRNMVGGEDELCLNGKGD